MLALVFAIGYMVGASTRGPRGVHATASGGDAALTTDSARLRDSMAAADSSARALAVDPLTGLDASAPGTPGAPAATPGSASPSPPASSAAALRALRAELIVPIAGVDVARIPDSFTAPRAGHTHQALDILAPRGTPIHSATPGTVLKLHNSVAGGLMVYAADSTRRFILLYAHLDRYAPGLREGAPLARGEVIGFVGTTGNAPASTPHLHFAIARSDDVSQWKGTPVDPWPLLAGAPQRPATAR